MLQYQRIQSKYWRRILKAPISAVVRVLQGIPALNQLQDLYHLLQHQHSITTFIKVRWISVCYLLLNVHHSTDDARFKKSHKEPNPWQAQNRVLLIPCCYCRCCYSSSVVVTPICWFLHKRILPPLSLTDTFKTRKYMYSLIQTPTVYIDYFKHCAKLVLLHSSSMAWFQHCATAMLKSNLICIIILSLAAQ